MLLLYNHQFETKRRVFVPKGDRVRIGRAPADNDLVLDDLPLVGERAAELRRTDAGWEFLALGIDCAVGGRAVEVGDRVPLAPGVVFSVPLFEFVLEDDAPTQAAAVAIDREGLDDRRADFIRELHERLLDRMNLPNSFKYTEAPSREAILALERQVEELAREAGLEGPGEEELIAHIAGCCLKAEILSDLIAASGADDAWNSRGHWSELASAVRDREAELRLIVGKLRRAMGIDRGDGGAAADLNRQLDTLDDRFWAEFAVISPELFVEDRSYLAMRHLKAEIKDIMFGYGPLEELLRSPAVSEIMVVDSKRIYIEKAGKIKNSGRRFVSDAVTVNIIERIVNKVQRQINRSEPLVDARLTDGSRVNAVIAPLAVSGPCITVRKFPARRLRAEDLVGRGALSKTAARFLMACVEARCNILVVGGTGTGKTTLLNCLAEFIPDDERIVTIEDTAELQLPKEHVVRLETKPHTAESRTEYTIASLVKNALRMRPDRIVVGECRDGAALEMLQAMNTGHDGSMTTLHANGSGEAVLRLEVMVQQADAKLPITSIRRQIASAIDLVVVLQRLRDGSRRVVQVTEYLDFDPLEGEVRMKDLFLLDDPDAPAPRLRPTGSLPTFMEKLIHLPRNPIRWEELFAPED